VAASVGLLTTFSYGEETATAASGPDEGTPEAQREAGGEAHRGRLLARPETPASDSSARRGMRSPRGPGRIPGPDGSPTRVDEVVSANTSTSGIQAPARGSFDTDVVVSRARPTGSMLAGWLTRLRV
jgi:hypothetical protein